MPIYRSGAIQNRLWVYGIFFKQESMHEILDPVHNTGVRYSTLYIMLHNGYISLTESFSCEARMMS